MTQLQWDNLLCNKRKVNSSKEKYVLAKFNDDYSSIVQSSMFRKLQDKTQVFAYERGTFARTRLTHSLEVTSCAKNICDEIVAKMPDAFTLEQWISIQKVLECGCLLHDIGNPPIGHDLEDVINDFFKCHKDPDFEELEDYGSEHINLKRDLMNFEGNAQALRIMSKLSNKHGINPTFAVYDSMVKYTVPAWIYDKDNKAEFKGSNTVWRHKPGYYYSEKNIFEAIKKNTNTCINGEYVRSPLAFILEAADDSAYLFHDLQDAVIRKVITLKQLQDFVANCYLTCYEGMFESVEQLQEFLSNQYHDYVKSLNGESLELKNFLDSLRKKPGISVAFEDLQLMVPESDTAFYHKKPTDIDIVIKYCSKTGKQKSIVSNVATSFVFNYEAIMNGEFIDELMEHLYYFKDGQYYEDKVNTTIIQQLKKQSYGLIYSKANYQEDSSLCQDLGIIVEKSDGGSEDSKQRNAKFSSLCADYMNDLYQALKLFEKKKLPEDSPFMTFLSESFVMDTYADEKRAVMRKPSIEEKRKYCHYLRYRCLCDMVTNMTDTEFVEELKKYQENKI